MVVNSTARWVQNGIDRRNHLAASATISTKSRMIAAK